MAKMGQLSPESKAIGLVFCRILTKMNFPGYRLGILRNFDDKSFSQILIAELKVAEMG